MLVFIVASEIDALKILLMDVAANNLLDIHATLINVQIKTSVCMQTCKLTACYLKKKTPINAKLLLLTTLPAVKLTCNSQA